MHRHLTRLLVLPTLFVCVCSASAQSDRFFHFNGQDSVPIWTKRFADSLTKEFNARGFAAPQWPNQQQKELLPKYPYPRYFSDPKLPGIPYPDLRNQPGGSNNEPLPRVIPRRRDSKELPNFPGWRIEKLKNLARA